MVQDLKILIPQLQTSNDPSVTLMRRHLKKRRVCCQSKQNGAKRFYEIGPGDFSLNNTQGLFVPTKAFSLLRHSHSKLQQFKRLFRMTRIVLANIPTILQ